MKKTRLLLLTTTIALLFASLASAQVQRDSIKVYFQQGKSALDPFYADNSRRLTDFTNKAKNLQREPDVTLDRVTVIAYSSPEGSVETNEHLVYLRAQSISEYLHQNLRFDENAFEVYFREMDWELFERLVSDDPFVPDRREILQLIKGRDLSKIQVPRFQKAWDYLLASVFPEMRATHVYFEYKTAPVAEGSKPAVKDPVKEEKEVKEEVRQPVVLPPLPDDDEDFTPLDLSEERQGGFNWYLKTNLLPWALLDANLAVEFEIGNHASFSLPVYYSAADWFRVRNKFRVFATQPEVRLWFRDDFSGPFVALHGTFGYYNVAMETMKFRVQDRDGRTPAYGGGLNFGWKFRLDRKRADRLGLELSFGAGYLHLDYDLFYNVENGRYSSSAVKDYFGPDHAAVTLTYRFGK